MKIHATRADLIAALTEDLQPVGRVKPAQGAALIAFATLVAGIVSVVIFDFWDGMLQGDASPFFWISNGLLLLLGAASTSALVAGTLPRVGHRPTAPSWAFAMLGVLPLAAIITFAGAPAAHSHEGLNDPAAWHCTVSSFAAALLVALACVMFLRRGAPVAIERSAWLTGLAAGSLGTFAYGITCPLDGMIHLGVWHFVPVVLTAIAARLCLPPLIRW